MNNPEPFPFPTDNHCRSRSSGKIQLSVLPYTLKLRHIFTIASNSRSSTPVVLIAITYEGVTGYGEASMPPYLGETQDSVLQFLNRLDLDKFQNPFLIQDILAYVDELVPGNTAAKAAVDIALHDLLGKLIGQPLYKLWGYNAASTPLTSFTIGIDENEVVKKKTREAGDFKLLKVKLGSSNDRAMIEAIRTVSDVPICVDVNQGWKNREQGLEMAHWLSERGVIFLEQPMPKEQVDDNAWLTEQSPIPTVADEAVQRASDVPSLKGVYSGINIKLMKCTGLREANTMIAMARALDMKVMLGCMTETSCAISAAAQLSPAVDWADLDGALLISNDPFHGMTVEGGRVVLPSAVGIGLHSGK